MNIFRLALLVLCLGFLTNCQSSSDSAKPPPARDIPGKAYSDASCELSANAGASTADTVPAPKVIESFFGKKFDSSLFDGVASANAIETVRFASLSDVSFFSVDRLVETSCLINSFLPKAESKYVALMQKIDRESEGKGSVVGLYLSPKNLSINKENEKAVILVREDAHRWVLVHEFMHHLFSREVQGTKNDTDLRNEDDKTVDDIAALQKIDKNTPSLSNTIELLKKYDSYLSLRTELITRYTLEEIAIETLMAEKLSTGQLANVSKHGAKSGASYIASSNETAQKSLGQLLRNTSAAAKEAEAIKAKDPTNSQLFSAKFAAHKNAIELLMSEAANLDQSATARAQVEATLNMNLSGFSENEESDNSQHLGCSHSHINLKPIPSF